MSQKNAAVSVHITFRHTDATDALREYATEKLTHCLQKFIHKDTEAHLVLKVEKNRQLAEVSFRADGADFRVSESSDSLYTAIDTAVATLSQQMRKHKDKITSHH